MLGMRPWGHLATLICSLYSDMIELLPPLNIISAFMHFLKVSFQRKFDKCY